MRRFILAIFLPLYTFSPLPAGGEGPGVRGLVAQDFKIEPAKSPRDSIKCIKPRPGFTVELMVAEPLVQSPIAFAWGADGKFWVVEMGDYPLGVPLTPDPSPTGRGGKSGSPLPSGEGSGVRGPRMGPGGKIKYLEKSKPDGPYDKMTVFMDGLGFPTGVFPYAKGVLVTCAPHIFYAEVGKDGKAANKKILFTGFREGNQQHRVNGLTWGIDNWIYGANGDSGGVVKSIKTGKEVNISGRDFRLKVESGEFEAVTGNSQFGRCRDDWGNWFGNNNSNPMYHYVLDDHYLKRNPHVLYPDTRVNVSVTPGAARVYPISKPLPRFNSPQALNHFTSACSTVIYRDTLFGKEFEGNMFVSEPVHNLVHREIVKPKGVTFTSQRADDEKESEFLASSDNWFRPTMIQVGPDGALWIADMYRYVIEHPEWIPKDWQKKLDLRAGHELGRIYRVYPADKKPRKIVRLDKMEVKELVNQLENPSGWVRDMAQQMLIGKAANDEKLALKAGELLEELMKKSDNAKARLHALYYPAGVSTFVWGADSLGDWMLDPHPAIRKHSTALCAEWYFLRRCEKALDRLENDTDPQVRQQLAYSLGSYLKQDKYSERLVRMLRKNADDPYILAAALSSVFDKKWKEVMAALTAQEKIPAALFGPMMRMAKAVGAPLDSSKLFVRQINAQERLPTPQLLAAVSEMVDLMEKNSISLKQMLEELADKDTEGTVARLRKIHGTAVKIAQDPKSANSEKLIALRLLARIRQG